MVSMENKLNRSVESRLKRKFFFFINKYFQSKGCARHVTETLKKTMGKKYNDIDEAN